MPSLVNEYFSDEVYLFLEEFVVILTVGMMDVHSETIERSDKFVDDAYLMPAMRLSDARFAQ
jgi:hypothetical protein